MTVLDLAKAHLANVEQDIVARQNQVQSLQAEIHNLAQYLDQGRTQIAEAEALAIADATAPEGNPETE